MGWGDAKLVAISERRWAHRLPFSRFLWLRRCRCRPPDRRVATPPHRIGAVHRGGYRRRNSTRPAPLGVARLRNLRTGNVVAEDVKKADSLWLRFTGFLTCGKIGPDQGLWFDNCSAIHTIGMRERIDAVFLAKDHRVMRVNYSVPPYRLVVICGGARAVIELGAAPAERRDLLVGDVLALE